MAKVINGDDKEYMECGPLQIFRYISCPAYHSLPYSSNMKDDALLFFQYRNEKKFEIPQSI